MKYATLIRLAVVSLSTLIASQSLVAQVAKTPQGNQPGQQPQEPAKPAYVTSKGTLGEVKKKGRATVLVIIPEAGEPLEVTVTPKVQFTVEAKGDAGFLREKQIVSGTGTLTNKMLFVKNWTVHTGLAARKMPTGVAKAEVTIGQSVNSYNLVGMIASKQQDKEYPEYETLSLNLRDLQGQPVYIDKNPTVTVSSSDAEMAKAGSRVEYYQVPAPGNRFNVIGVKVMLEEPLKSEEFFADPDDKKKKTRETAK